MIADQRIFVKLFFKALATIHIFAQVRIKKALQDHGITPHLTVLFDCVVFN